MSDLAFTATEAVRAAQAARSAFSHAQRALDIAETRVRNLPMLLVGGPKHGEVISIPSEGRTAFHVTAPGQDDFGSIDLSVVIYIPRTIREGGIRYMILAPRDQPDSETARLFECFHSGLRMIAWRGPDGLL